MFNKRNKKNTWKKQKNERKNKINNLNSKLISSTLNNIQHYNSDLEKKSLTEYDDNFVSKKNKKLQTNKINKKNQTRSIKIPLIHKKDSESKLSNKLSIDTNLIRNKRWTVGDPIEIEKLVAITTGNVLSMLKDNPEMLNALILESKKETPMDTKRDTPRNNQRDQLKKPPILGNKRVEFKKKQRSGLSSVTKHKIKTFNFMRPTNSSLGKIKSPRVPKKQVIKPPFKSKKKLLASSVLISTTDKFEHKVHRRSLSNKKSDWEAKKKIKKPEKKYLKRKKNKKKEKEFEAKKYKTLKNPVPQNMNNRIKKHKEKKNDPAEVLKLSSFGRNKSWSKNKNTKKRFSNLQIPKMPKKLFRPKPKLSYLKKSKPIILLNSR